VVELVLAAYLSMSALAFALYAADKRRAARGQWRISEATLHTIELLGGWPGAIVAQHLLHHKRQKPRYMRVFWLIVAIHVIAWSIEFSSCRGSPKSMRSVEQPNVAATIRPPIRAARPRRFRRF
jgi:uncharacterized membrane protein YsdA (DUF1294 family)